MLRPLVSAIIPTRNQSNFSTSKGKCMVKVALIGAGSAVFAQRMITDIMAIDGLDAGTFALVDLDTERLELAHEVAEQTITTAGKQWTVLATTERRNVLSDCDYVINMIEVGGLANVFSDYAIPSKYGVDQCIADTIGPGGISNIYAPHHPGSLCVAILKNSAHAHWLSTIAIRCPP